MEELGFKIIWQEGKRPTLELSFPGAAYYTCSPVELTVADQFIETSKKLALGLPAAEVLCRELLDKGLPQELTLDKHNVLLIDGIPYVREGRYLCGTKTFDYVCISSEQFEKIRSVWETLKQKAPFPYRVENFDYNGFAMKHLPGFAPYSAAFVEWTADPGVAKMKCSDGKDRLIPVMALETDLFLPKAERKETVLFGAPSSSN